MKTFPTSQDDENDMISTSNGAVKSFKVVEDDEAVLAISRNVVMTQRGELIYDLRRGIPYKETILGASPTSEKVVIWQSFMEQAILGIDGVKSISYFILDYNAPTLSYECGIETIYGKVVLNG